MFRYIAAIVAIAAAPHNVAADSNPAHLRLLGISDSDFDRGVDPATLIAAKTSSRELSSTIVWSDPVNGTCRDSSSTSYPSVVIDPIPTTTLSDEDWCKAWCASVQPEKVVGMGIHYSTCYCFFDISDLPNLFPRLSAYDPDATGYSGNYSGTGCITQTSNSSTRKCYRNCSYKQCIGESGYDSCCSSNPSSQPSSSQTLSLQTSSSKSGKSSSLGPKAGKGSKTMKHGLTGGTNFQFAGGAGSGNQLSEASAIAPSSVDDPVLLKAEGLFSMPTEFNEWGDIVSMSMENEESTIRA